ncbi:MAG TPA: hypothetical protein VJ725_23050 [Thermoanaerobaculia bacterium]|nr:hypothetical protein [Thermoanaerobaculia bacterium]
MPMQFPPFERYLLTLRLTAPAKFHFLHGGALRGLLSAALEQHELPVEIVPFAPESGRARFDTGEAYRLGLTLTGPEAASAGKLLRGLERVGRQAPRKTEGPPPTLGGNFRLEAAEPLPAADLNAEAAALAGLDAVTRGGPLASRGGPLASRGGPLASRGGSPASRGGSPASRGGSLASRGGSLASRVVSYFEIRSPGRSGLR